MAEFEPGEWPIVYPAGVPDILAESGIDQNAFERMAAENLWNWTQRVFSVYDVEVRPVRFPKPWVPSTFEGLGPWPVNPGYGSGHSTMGWTFGYWAPVLISGAWAAIVCGVCGQAECYCRGDQIKTISLPGSVVEVNEVRVNGDVIPSSAYWLRQKRFLERTDGQPWPFWQDLNLPDTEDNTWVVKYVKGIPVPPGGQIAAGVLAEQLALAIHAPNDCKLPKRIQTVTREGVTIGVVDPFAATKGSSRASVEIPKIDTGIWEIDSWMAGVNMPRSIATVRSVDTPGTTRWNYGGNPRSNYGVPR